MSNLAKLEAGVGKLLAAIPEGREGDMWAHYTRLFTDDQGESCFEELAIELAQGLPVRGADPVAIAPFLSSEGTF